MKSYIYIFLLLWFFCGCINQNLQETEVKYQKHKDTLMEVARRCYERELTSGTGGDISVRIPGTNRFIIKGTGNCFYDLDYSKLSTVSLESKLIDGPTFSHETPIHAEIYKMRDEVGAVMHMHSPYATAWGCVGRKIPPVTQQSVKLLKDIGIDKPNKQFIINPMKLSNHV